MKEMTIKNFLQEITLFKYPNESMRQWSLQIAFQKFHQLKPGYTAFLV